MYYTTWMKNAMENATTKGFTVLYREKILPALSLNKGQRSNNSAAVKIVSEEARKKFVESWKTQQSTLMQTILGGARSKRL